MPKSAQSRKLRVLRSATRQEIVDVLACHGGLTAAQLAEITGRSVTSLYYHLKLLTEAGLLSIDPSMEQTAYRLAPRGDQVRPQSGSRQQAEDTSEAAGSMLRLTERELRRAVEDGEASRGGSTRKCRFSRQKAWLTQSELRELNQHLDALSALLRKGRRPGRGTLCSLTYVLTPASSSARDLRDD